jgi:uncharacterized protein YrrD
MRLSDLLDTPVVSADGHELGRVRDIRFVQEAEPIAGPGRYLADGLIISHHAFGARLGLARPQVKGPWLLKAIEQRLHRHATWIPIQEIASMTAEHIVLKRRAGD